MGIDHLSSTILLEKITWNYDGIEKMLELR